jgi:Ca-activated chloride channel family protein
MKLSIYIGAGLIAGLGIITPALADSLDATAREGVTHYNREEFKQAASKFEASRLEQPDNSEVAYNLANSHYRLGRYEAAVEAYRQALSETPAPELQQKSHYNMGNAYYRMGYLDEAIESYKKALAVDPGDMDSKFNLEWTRKQYEKAVKSGQVGPRDKNLQPERTPREQGLNPPAPRQEPPETPGSQKEESETAENQRSPSSPPASEEPAEEDKAVRDALQEMIQMTPEEAERWLGSLSEDLKKITRRQMQGQMKDMFVDHDKNW